MRCKPSFLRHRYLYQLKFRHYQQIPTRCRLYTAMPVKQYLQLYEHQIYLQGHSILFQLKQYLCKEYAYLYLLLLPCRRLLSWTYDFLVHMKRYIHQEHFLLQNIWPKTFHHENKQEDHSMYIPKNCSVKEQLQIFLLYLNLLK